MKEKGFEGTISSTYRYLLHLGMKTGQPEQKLQPRRFTARQAAWIITTSDQNLDDHQRKYRDILYDLSPMVLEASKFANGFIQMVKEQKKDQLFSWIENAKKCSASSNTFAN
jgi:hypothetical protein